ncbi:stress-inducible protein [Streptomyces pluripotens]|uniref:Stress-inducible protein n=1 Tax=Streptomyces pluripotens TaxID=1355015 RepID=A0A221P645_9ACTN|nr:MULTISPECIES: universal stress protein [Streptomyces]ARP73374.1 stress-inducible protein [Streptomyces pluripotens]ASN27622.1 stress-inducible protein [Streptomyces pluripotens]KIE28542.1 stress-inducible protein [Streptomyces sp. MUSC 125]MCH0560302.1 universal stress protein [Streptomyces sp. MUM 16J]
MPHTITAGLDGSPESLAAADWAAREALLRDTPLHLVHALRREPDTHPPAGGTPQPPQDPGVQDQRADRLLRETAATLARNHPGLQIITDHVPGEPAPALLEAAEEADLLVLGSRGLGGVARFLVGSVVLAVMTGSRRPVVVVRDGLRAEDEHQPGTPGTGAESFRDVVLGLGSAAPDDAVIGFAFDAAARRGARLRVVRGWSPDQPQDGDGDLSAELHAELTGDTQRALSEVLDPWRNKFPGVEVVEQAVIGKAGSHLVEASHDASLVVVGRRRRRTPAGTAIGPVTHAVLHHGGAPVAVVPHD